MLSLVNSIQLLLVHVNLLCKLYSANPDCIHQLGHLEVFDLNKEFILCIYGDRLEEKKYRLFCFKMTEHLNEVLGVFLNSAETELFGPATQLNATQLFLSVWCKV